MKVRKMLALLLAGAMTVGMTAGCGSGSSGSAGNSGNQADSGTTAGSGNETSAETGGAGTGRLFWGKRRSG